MPMLEGNLYTAIESVAAMLLVGFAIWIIFRSEKSS